MYTRQKGVIAVDIGERIKKLRTAKKLTQQSFADKISVKRNTVALYEASKISPSDAVLSLICREFGVSENWLRTGEGEMFLPEDEESLLLDSSLDQADRAILRAYIDAPPKVKAYIKQAIVNAAKLIEAPTAPVESEAVIQDYRTSETEPPTDAPPGHDFSMFAPSPKPPELSEEEWILVQRHREAKESTAQEAG